MSTELVQTTESTSDSVRTSLTRISGRRICTQLLRRGHETLDARQAETTDLPRPARRRSRGAFDADQSRGDRLHGTLHL
jgi:hypothetical protein